MGIRSLPAAPRSGVARLPGGNWPPPYARKEKQDGWRPDASGRAATLHHWVCRDRDQQRSSVSALEWPARGRIAADRAGLDASSAAEHRSLGAALHDGRPLVKVYETETHSH